MRTIQSHTIEAMTMPFTLCLVGQDKQVVTEALSQLVEPVTEELGRLEAKFSPFLPHSLVTQFRQGQVKVLFDKEFQEVYTAVQAAKIETEGFFNPYDHDAYDPTGFVKGWIVEKIYRKYLLPLLVNPLIEAVAINGAGDMQFATAQSSDFSWKIGIENPDKPQDLLAQLTMKAGAVATSGYSKRGRHLRILGPEDLKQVTIIGHSLSWADVWATAALSAGQTVFDRLLVQEKLSGLYIHQTGLQFFRNGEFETCQKTII
ncbi:FAD:protein FMN transferase [Streptococcus cuniculipharyngis]|uniref:FAD:protein FMN transferase n=2 Tax=Streptococcus cuniculipharyngis TaxID=1562651 RepID=A0A5C5SEK0_9STRE|nr:FAD:protein FMN transferase [Streptococcus cuniculipharyngis]